MDKLLLAAFLSSLAGFLTAIISFVKLVNEKEAKISDARRLWNDSVRKSFADLAAKLTVMTADYEEQNRFFEALTEEKQNLENSTSDPEKERIKEEIDHYKELLKATQRDIQDKRHELSNSYAFTKLHFKPNDISFSRVEQKYELIKSLMDQLFSEARHDKRIELKDKINSHINEMVEICRDILKTEWEIVKKGEPSYAKTVKLAARGGLVMLFLLISIGIHAFVSMTEAYKNHPADPPKNPIHNCWLIQNISGVMYKINSCTGESSELPSHPNHENQIDTLPH